MMNIVLIIPTGIGATIGGHAGDANPVAKLFGSCCDLLITHPNVVNASDINEMPVNTLYVEGSILDRFLRGEINLRQPIWSNKILLAVNKPVDNMTVNAVNAAKVTIGANIEVVELSTPLVMIGNYSEDGRANGTVSGIDELVDQTRPLEFDALAIQTRIQISRETKLHYLKNGGVNPWGGVEAIASKWIARRLDKPVAHAPYVDWNADIEENLKDFSEIVDPRLSAEMISNCYLHSVLKGLHRAPRIDYTNRGICNLDINFLISPINCVGIPHIACQRAGIPIIAVEENKTILDDTMPSNFIIVKNYLEAAGVVMACKAGVSIQSVLVR